MQKHLAAIAVGALAATNLLAAPVAVQSPHGQVTASFEVENGELFCSVSKGGTPVVGSSQVEIFAGATMALAGQSTRDKPTRQGTSIPVYDPAYGRVPPESRKR